MFVTSEPPPSSVKDPNRKREFEDWYREVIESGILSDCSLKTILQMAWIVGGDPLSAKFTSFSINERYEDLVLSFDTLDGNEDLFAKFHPDIVAGDNKTEDANTSS